MYRSILFYYIIHSIHLFWLDNVIERYVLPPVYPLTVWSIHSLLQQKFPLLYASPFPPGRGGAVLYIVWCLSSVWYRWYTKRDGKLVDQLLIDCVYICQSILKVKVSLGWRQPHLIVIVPRDWENLHMDGFKVVSISPAGDGNNLRTAKTSCREYSTHACRMLNYETKESCSSPSQESYRECCD